MSTFLMCLNLKIQKSNSKNIKIFKGLITNNKKVENHDKEDARIKKENDLLHTFYF